MGFIPGGILGYGTPRIFTPTKVLDVNGSTLVSGLNDDGNFRRWAVAVYNEQLYYTNDLNQIHQHSASGDVVLSNAPQARYLLAWYDHLVAAYITQNGSFFPHRLSISELYDFNTWQPDKINEADFYDFVEWESSEYALSGVTGIAKLRNTMFVYTPTAIIPLQYVGKPKVIRIEDSGIITRVGNGMPWTLVALDNVHLFFDAIEGTFFAFDGQQIIPIGEPVRNFINQNLNTTPTLATKMYGYVDVDNREVWWPFVSTGSSGAFDKAVVFNYRYKKWFTASVENIMSFSGRILTAFTVADLAGTVGSLTGTVGQLGLGTSGSPRLFGTDTGKIYREEVSTDADTVLISQDDPVLESADFVYGDIRTYKENDLMLINAGLTQETLAAGPFSVKPGVGGSFPVTESGLTVGVHYFFDLQNATSVNSTVTGLPLLTASGFLVADATSVLVVGTISPPTSWTGSMFYVLTVPVVVGLLYTWQPPTSTYLALWNGSQLIQPTTFPTTIQFTALDTHVYVYFGLIGGSSGAPSAAYVYPASGIALQVSGRDYLGGEVDWSSVPILGSWAPNLQDGQLTYAAVRGRVLRYQFTAKFIRQCLMSAYSDGIYIKQAEK